MTKTIAYVIDLLTFVVIILCVFAVWFGHSLGFARADDFWANYFKPGKHVVHNVKSLDGGCVEYEAKLVLDDGHH